VKLSFCAKEARAVSQNFSFLAKQFLLVIQVVDGRCAGIACISRFLERREAGRICYR
jgi:hypothetical protein